MPVEIREVVIRAELSQRPLNETASDRPCELTPEQIEAIQLICEDEFQRLSDGFSPRTISGKFAR